MSDRSSDPKSRLTGRTGRRRLMGLRDRSDARAGESPLQGRSRAPLSDLCKAGAAKHHQACDGCACPCHRSLSERPE